MKSYTRIYILIVWLIAGAYCGNAQIVTGKVIDILSKEPIPYATITLHQSDSTLINGVVSDEYGVFMIPITESLNDLLIRVKSVGYREKYFTIENIDNPLTLSLDRDEVLLNEVVISANRPVYSLNNSGNLVTKVSGTFLEDIVNVRELIKSIPGIMEFEGVLKTISGATPIVYLNGRKVRTMTEVMSLNVKDIQSIEINNNPGVEYDAEVGAVIRINTINPAAGLTFNTGVSVSKSRVLSHNEFINTSYSIKDFVFYASLRYSDNRKKSIQDIIYTWVLPRASDEFYSRNYLISTPSSVNRINYSLGCDFRISRSKQLSLSWDSSLTHLLDIGNSKNQVKDGSDALIGFESLSNIQDSSNYGHLIATYKYNGNNGFEANITGDYASTIGNRKQTTTEFFRDTENETKIQNSNAYKLYSLATKISFPLNSKLSLNSGGQYDYITNSQKQEYYHSADVKPSISKEAIFAIYLGLNYKENDLNGQVGLRFERSNYVYQVEHKKETLEKQQLLPYIALTYKLGKTSHNLSYRYSTQRPTLGFLGGYSYYLNRFSMQKGNPQLRPQYTHNLDYSFVWKPLYFNANYQYIQSPIMPLSFLLQENGSKTVVNSWYNFSKQNNITLLLNYSDTFDWYRPSITIAYIHHINQVESDEKQIKHLSNPVPFLQIQNTFTFCDIETKVDYQYTGRGYFRIFLFEPQHIINLSLQKKFLNNSLVIRIYWNDILRQSVDKYTSDYRGLKFLQSEDQDRSNFGVAINYRFRDKQKRQVLKSTDELKRF